ncbi:hypothetical protein DM807_02980 [Pseudomonas hunanensis]|nr:hypothetical protein [Pseudomonas hunanensis]RNF67218.1 hypothetical protein EFJ98_23920 [Pseudomonas putida]
MQGHCWRGLPLLQRNVYPCRSGLVSRMGRKAAPRSIRRRRVLVGLHSPDATATAASAGRF